MLEQWEAIQRQFAEALQGAGKRYQRAEVVEESATVQFSDRNFQDVKKDVMTMSDEETKRNVSENPFIVVSNNTPKVILENSTDAKNLEFIMRFDVIYLAAREEGVLEGNYYGVDADVFFNIMDYISDPLAIIKIGDRRYNIIAGFSGSNGNDLISIEINSKKRLS